MIPTGKRSLERWEWGALLLLVLASLAVHYHFRIRGFGEQDQARIGVFVLTWRESGTFSTDTYLNRTSPIYVLLLDLALDHGLTRSRFAEALNLVSVVVGSLTLAPMFLLFRLLIGAALTAFLAVAVYWFAPAFWYGNGYGMPHIPAFALLLVSLYCFGRALTADTHGFTRWSVAAALAIAGATCFKADVALCGLAFPALVPALGPVTRRRLLTALAIPTFGVVVVMTVSRVFLPVPVSTRDFAAGWSSQFPFDARQFVSFQHWKITLRSLGWAAWLAAGGALVLGFVRGKRAEGELRDYRALLLVTGAWAMPTVLFWSLIEAHAPRHLTSALCPVALLIVAGVRSLLPSEGLTAAGVAGLIGLNYFCDGPKNHPHVAGTRLFASRERMQSLVDDFSRSGEAFAAIQADKKRLFGHAAIPYCEYALLERARHFERRYHTVGLSWDLDVWEPGRSAPLRVEVRYGPPPPSAVSTADDLAWHAELGRKL